MTAWGIMYWKLRGQMQLLILLPFWISTVTFYDIIYVNSTPHIQTLNIINFRNKFSNHSISAPASHSLSCVLTSSCWHVLKLNGIFSQFPV